MKPGQKPPPPKRTKAPPAPRGSLKSAGRVRSSERAAPGPRSSTRKARIQAPTRQLQVYKAWCKKCGLCIAFCPSGALAGDAEGYPCWAKAASCTNCGLCELRCPDFAIEVFDSEEEDRAAPV